MELHWERLQTFHDEKEGPRYWQEFRARVPGGWLIKTSYGDSVGLTFYPDPDYLWDKVEEAVRKERALRQQGKELLHPSERPAESSGTLLRPAQDDSATPADQLLRPDESQEE